VASLYAPQGHKGVCSCESWVVEIRSLSATIMSEFANKKTRGAFIAAVFSMQGFGILAASAVTMVVCKNLTEHQMCRRMVGHQIRQILRGG
jgi:hypothetical protein